MLEKIGLPPKPSARGNVWVVDATHCQGCSSQFTFINRKHHCRRCGGIFCNGCTQQRMVLRGQGDSPVRICEPCKKLEEAARFEMRHGHKNRVGRGGSRHASKNKEDLLNSILGNDQNEQLSAGQSSSFPHGTSSSGNDEPKHILTEIDSTTTITTPELLREQAMDEKKRYKLLKAEGKSDEALKAFKKGKELERQAAALEISLRKSRKKALISDNIEESSKKNKLLPQKSKDENDLADELRELGWSDVDIHHADKKPAIVSLEGELSSLVQKTNTEKGSKIDNSQVVFHKKRALALKREGKMAEAKEELKKAKILEKQIEEQEFLGEADDSDDEISSLMRSLDMNKDENLDIRYDFHPNFDLNSLNDPFMDSNFEVTEADMDSPEIAAALKSLGWSEDINHNDDNESQVLSIDREEQVSQIQSSKKAGKLVPKKSKLAIQKELLALKKQALALRREGRLDEADEELKKGKILEQQLEDMNNGGTSNSTQFHISTKHSDIGDEAVDVSDQDMEDSTYLSVLKNLGWNDEDNEKKLSPPSKVNDGIIVHSFKSRGEIQRALLGLKRKSLALRRQGNVGEAEEVLKEAKSLEDQLAEIEAPKKEENTINFIGGSKLEEEKNTNDFDVVFAAPKKEEASTNFNQGRTKLEEQKNKNNFDIVSAAPRRSKTELQRELLGLKRKVLALRRKGETEEADEVLRTAKELEVEMENLDGLMNERSDANNVVDPKNMSENIVDGSTVSGKDEKQEEIVHAVESNSLQQDILAHKRRAVALKREGKLAEAKEELRQAKLLEKQSENENKNENENDSSSSILASTGKTEQISKSAPGKTEQSKTELISKSTVKPLSSRDRFKLQQESLGHKRQALKLRREGRNEEAEAEFELAKALETQLEEHDSANRAVNLAGEPGNDVSVEDFLDPQILSALKAIGLGDDDVISGAQSSENSERVQLEEQIKAEKVKAVNFKRSGKQTEALDALRRAKALEKKLNSLAS